MAWGESKFPRRSGPIAGEGPSGAADGHNLVVEEETNGVDLQEEEFQMDFDRGRFIHNTIPPFRTL